MNRNTVRKVTESWDHPLASHSPRFSFSLPPAQFAGGELLPPDPAMHGKRADLWARTKIALEYAILAPNSGLLLFWGTQHHPKCPLLI